MIDTLSVARVQSSVGGSVPRLIRRVPATGVVGFDYERLQRPQVARSSHESGTPVLVAARQAAAGTPVVTAARAVGGDRPPPGLSAAAWQTITRAIERDQYGVRQTAEDGLAEIALEGANPAQAYTTRFTPPEN